MCTTNPQIAQRVRMPSYPSRYPVILPNSSNTKWDCWCRNNLSQTWKFWIFAKTAHEYRVNIPHSLFINRFLCPQFIHSLISLSENYKSSVMLKQLLQSPSLSYQEKVCFSMAWLLTRNLFSACLYLKQLVC